jgi:hypothetical protein
MIQKNDGDQQRIRLYVTSIFTGSDDSPEDESTLPVAYGADSTLAGRGWRLVDDSPNARDEIPTEKTVSVR